MKILLVVANFIPEIGSAAHLYFDLAKAFVRKDHEIHVITSYPRSFNVQEQDTNNDFPKEETIDGIHIHRCKHPAQRDNVILRGFEHFIIPTYYFRLYKHLDIDFDACLMYIPPLPLYYLAKKIKRYDGTKSVLNFQDFHPQELTDVGVLKNPLMIKLLKHIERLAYKHADHITVLSKRGIDYVVKRGADPKKVSHIYNSVLLDSFDTSSLKKDFKEKQKITDKFLVTYAGILSPYQGIDHILDAAKKMNDIDDVVFYIVGEGTEKPRLEQRISTEHITNVTLLPYQNRDDYFNIINSSDISLISLDERMNAPCLPGKIKDLLALKKPIIASVPKDSETADIITHADCGIVVEPGNTKDLSKSIISIKNNQTVRNEKGNKGQEFLKENMDISKNVEMYEIIFQKMIK
jgi:colanic acid biosynthesis glycosyl transferase WcaI